MPALHANPDGQSVLVAHVVLQTCPAPKASAMQVPGKLLPDASHCEEVVHDVHAGLRLPLTTQTRLSHLFPGPHCASVVHP